MSENESRDRLPKPRSYPLALAGMINWQARKGESSERAWAIDASGPAWRALASLRAGRCADLSGYGFFPIDPPAPLHSLALLSSERAPSELVITVMFDAQDRVDEAGTRLLSEGEPGGEPIERLIARLALCELPSAAGEEEGRELWRGALKALMEARELGAEALASKRVEAPRI